jgi:DNA modification methylase
MQYNKIENSDCLEYLSKIQDNSVDMIFTDPPYGVNYKNDIYNDNQDYVKEQSKIWLAEMYRVLKDTCHCYIFTGTKSLGFWLNNIEDSDFTFKNIINIKSYCNGQCLKNNFYFRTEHLIFLSKGKTKKLNEVNWLPTSDDWKLKDKRNPNPKDYTYAYPNFINNLFANEKGKSKIHPNQKNLETTKIFVQLSSNVGDVILDPFAGSGTTAVACKQTGRNFLSCEQNKEMCELANNRLDKILL